MTQDCKRDANPAHFSLGVLFNAPKNRLRTKYVTVAILITALVAPALLPGDIQTAQADRFADETAQFTEKVGRPPSPTEKDANGWTDLHYAAALNFASLAERMLESGAKADARLKSDGEPLTDELKAILRRFGKDYGGWNRGGEAPLDIAVKENALETVTLLIKKAADVNAKTDDGEAPLAVAPEYSAGETAAALLRFTTDVGHMPSPTEKDANDWTDLHYAAILNLPSLADGLLQSGAKVDAKLKFDGEPLTNELKAILRRFEKDYGNRYRDRESPQIQYTAGKPPRIDIVAKEDARKLSTSTLLHEKVAAMNAKDNDGQSPLTVVLGYGAGETVTLPHFKTEFGRLPLLGAKDANDWTDLRYATALNFPSLAKRLLQSGAKVGVILKYDHEPFTDELKATLRQDYGGREKFRGTPLDIAAWANARDTADLLLEKGAAVNAEIDDEWAPLDIAAWANARDTADLLLEKGAKVNAKNDDWGTPLHIAVWRNARNTAALLLEKGAKVNAKNDYWGTPLHIAAWGNTHDTAALLLEKGAKVNAKNDYWGARATYCGMGKRPRYRRPAA